MARPHKAPLTYFPFSTLFPADDKIVILRREYGVKGEGVIVRLWCALYGTYGYYLPFDDVNTPPTIAPVDDRRYGVTSTLVVAIVNRCLQVGLFHEPLFKQYGILTSEAIQERYFRAVNRRRGVTAIRQYLLVTPPVGIVIVDNNPIIARNNELKEIKDNNILPNGRISLSLTERENIIFLNNPLKKEKKKESDATASLIEIFFFRNLHTPATEAERFVNHYNARGWRDRSGAEIHDIPSLARAWEQRKKLQPPHHFEALESFKKLYTLFRPTMTVAKREELLTLVTAITVEEQTLYITCPQIVAEYIDEQIKKHIDKARAIFAQYKTLKYRIV